MKQTHCIRTLLNKLRTAQLRTISPRKVPDRVRLANRVIDLRVSAAQSTFLIQSEVGRAFREFLDSKDFIEIHTPWLQGGVAESGASFFKVGYLRRPCSLLTQSPELAKQIATASNFSRVYEIGPVFCAENIKINWHMTEITDLDI